MTAPLGEQTRDGASLLTMPTMLTMPTVDVDIDTAAQENAHSPDIRDAAIVARIGAPDGLLRKTPRFTS